MLADVLLFEAPVFGSGALDGDLDRVVAVAAVDGVDGVGQAGLLGTVDRVEQVGLDGRGGGDVPDDDARFFIMIGGRAVPIGAEQRDGGVDDLLLVVGRYGQVDRPVDAPGGQVVLPLTIRCESEESFYVAFTTFGKSFDCLMNQNPLVTADTQRSRVNKTNVDTGA